MQLPALALHQGSVACFWFPGLQALAELEHPIARHIIEYRQIKKLLADLDSYCSTRDTRRASGGSDGSVRRCSPMKNQQPLALLSPLNWGNT